MTGVATLRRAVPALAAVAFLVCAASARATTYCVPAASASCSGTSESTIANALSAAGGHAGRDTIQIAAGTYDEDGLSDASGNPVDIVGAGPTQTLIRTATAGNSETTLSIAEPSSTIAHVGIEMPKGSGGAGTGETGLSMQDGPAVGVAATDVAVTAPDPVTSSTGVAFTGFAGKASFSSGSVVLPSDSASSDTGISSFFGAVQDSTVVAGIGISGAGRARRVRVTATTGISDGFGTETVEDALITLPAGTTNGFALLANGTLGSVAMTVRHVTLMGTGDASNTGVACAAITIAGGSTSCSTTVDGAIVRGFGHDLSRSAAAVTGPANATLSVDYSDYDPSTDADSNTSGGTGATTAGSHNVNVDPGFVSTSGGDPQAFHLLASSPLVDSGNPSFPPGESTTDLAGNPRVVAGKTPTTPISDIGAFEFQAHAPTAAAAAAPPGAFAGQPVTFSAGGSSDPDPGDALSYSWAFDDGGTATGLAVVHAFATRGVHHGTVTVTDLSHRTATANAAVTVSSRPLPPAPRISALSLRPASFRVRSGGRGGTNVRFRLSEAAIVRFTIQVLRPGRRHGRACVPVTRRNRHARRCSRWVTVSTFTFAGRSGADRLHYTGRIGRRALRPGRYRLVATPRAHGRSGRALAAGFRVRP